LLTRKSVASKAVFPKIVTFDNILDDSAAGMPAMKTQNPLIQATFWRERLFFSVNAAVIISSILKDEVKTANKNNSKNNVKKRFPKAILPNASGSTTNNKPGPCAGSSPNAKTTGKIANPASKETKMFMMETEAADVGKLTFFPK